MATQVYNNKNRKNNNNKKRKRESGVQFQVTFNGVAELEGEDRNKSRRTNIGRKFKDDVDDSNTLNEDWKDNNNGNRDFKAKRKFQKYEKKQPFSEKMK
jgi:hypothetical protein